jgi:hypothetical protein
VVDVHDTGDRVIRKNSRFFVVLSWVLTGIVGICGITIISCGITGDYCILTGWDNRPDNALAGLLLIAGAAVCGWGNGVRGE